MNAGLRDMENITPGVRNTVRALIIDDGRILLLRKEADEQGARYALPGGAQESGETLSQALQRECLEEIGTQVRIRDLLHLADWFKPCATVPPSTKQLVEFLFDCSLPPGYRPHNGHRPDRRQLDVVWVGMDEMANIRLLPRTLTGYLSLYPGTEHGVYLGSID